jgi:hypothetical protein
VGRAIYRDVEQASSFLPDSPLPDEQIVDPKDPKSIEDNAGVQALGVVVSNRTGSPIEQKSYAGVRGLMIERARYSRGKKGVSRVAQFVFIGPRVGDSKGGGTPNYELEAFSVNRNGHIIFAPDLGSERQRFSPSFSKTTLPYTYKDPKLQQLDVQFR